MFPSKTSMKSHFVFSGQMWRKLNWKL